MYFLIHMKFFIMLSTFKVYVILCCMMSLCNLSEAIDCFKCISVNNDYKACEDPFHNNYTLDIYESPCMGGKKGREGLFPATSCIKIIGTFDDNGDTITVRGCALDSGTLTTDTEIVRLSHCGGFYYDDRYVRGCVQSCNNADACNIANTFSKNKMLVYFIILGNYLLNFFQSI